MVIQRSSSSQTAGLVDDLLGDDLVRREAAVARLILLGDRAVDRLLAALTDAPAPARVAMLRALEAIASPRTLPALTMLLGAQEDAVSVAAAGAVRPHLRSADDAVAASALAALTMLVVDTSRSDPPRLAALDALGDMGADTLRPVRERLRTDPSPRVRRLAGWVEDQTPESAAARLEAAARGDLPTDGELLRELLTEAGAVVALSKLHDLVSVLRTRERSEARLAVKSEWTMARGAAHVALAERRSRLAVYDLRETLERASAELPLGFLAAATRVGDASCLEAIAEAWERVDEPWMRDRLAGAFREILARERLTRRHAAVKRVVERRPDAAHALLGPSPGRA